MTAAVTIVVKVIILAIFSQYLGATIPFLGTVLYFLQRFYLQTSRQVRLLGIEVRAPLYAHFTESVAGAATIRAFDWKIEYAERNYRHIDTSQRPTYLQHCIQAWLAFVLNVMAAVLAVTLVGTVVTWHDKFSAGSVGVSLVMVIGFSQVLDRLVQSWTRLESSVGAVARIKRFTDETESEETAGRGAVVPPEWPQAGGLEFSGVVASYGYILCEIGAKPDELIMDIDLTQTRFSTASRFQSRLDNTLQSAAAQAAARLRSSCPCCR